jgi:hypothetical protein
MRTRQPKGGGRGATSPHVAMSIKGAQDLVQGRGQTPKGGGRSATFPPLDMSIEEANDQAYGRGQTPKGGGRSATFPRDKAKIRRPDGGNRLKSHHRASQLRAAAATE